MFDKVLNTHLRLAWTLLSNSKETRRPIQQEKQAKLTHYLTQPSHPKLRRKQRKEKESSLLIQEREILFQKQNRKEERIIEHNSVPPLQSVLFYKYLFQIFGIPLKDFALH